MHADKYENDLITRDLIYFLMQVGLIKDNEFAHYMRVLIGRIDQLVREEAKP